MSEGSGRERASRTVLVIEAPVWRVGVAFGRFGVTVIHGSLKTWGRPGFDEGNDVSPERAECARDTR